VLPRYPLASVDHALQILERLRIEPRLRLSDLARELDIANSTAHRLLAALAHRGFVEQEPGTRRYRAGPALLDIGRSAVVHEELRTRVRPILVAVSRELGETLHVGVREGRSVRYLDAVESPRAVRVAARTGRTLPAHWTSTGKVLLAGLSDESIRRLYGSTTLPTRTVNSISRLDDLLADLAVCRRLGHAVNRGESEDDVVSVAVALSRHDGTVVAAISCAAPQHRLDVADAPAVAACMRSTVASTGDAAAS